MSVRRVRKASGENKEGIVVLEAGLLEAIRLESEVLG
jgi:hypothetical protein